MILFKVALIIVCLLSLLCVVALSIPIYLSITGNPKNKGGLNTFYFWPVIPASWTGVPEEDYPLIFWGRIAYFVFWGSLLIAYFLGPAS